jgi:hypothetical protein
MRNLTDTFTMKAWQAYLLIGLSGFAVGNIIAKTQFALGF